MPELDLRTEQATDPAADLGRYLAAGRRVLGWVAAAEALAAIYTKYGLEIVGPPPAPP
jgi:hypothetical protein